MSDRAAWPYVACDKCGPVKSEDGWYTLGRCECGGSVRIVGRDRRLLTIDLGYKPQGPVESDHEATA